MCYGGLPVATTAWRARRVWTAPSSGVETRWRGEAGGAERYGMTRARRVGVTAWRVRRVDCPLRGVETRWRGEAEVAGALRDDACAARGRYGMARAARGLSPTWRRDAVAGRGRGGRSVTAWRVWRVDCPLLRVKGERSAQRRRSQDRRGAAPPRSARRQRSVRSRSVSRPHEFDRFVSAAAGAAAGPLCLADQRPPARAWTRGPMLGGLAARTSVPAIRPWPE